MSPSSLTPQTFRGPLRPHFYAGPRGAELVQALTQRYGHWPLGDASLVVPVGGDGTMLRALGACHKNALPFYGLHTGHHGALMNSAQGVLGGDLLARVQEAEPLMWHPLQVHYSLSTGEECSALAFNEVSLQKHHNRALTFSLKVNGVMWGEEILGDGLVVATPLGSSGYNRSAGGALIDPALRALVITPLALFYPSSWSSIVLPDHHSIACTIKDAQERPGALAFDTHYAAGVIHCRIVSANTGCVLLRERPRPPLFKEYRHLAWSPLHKAPLGP